MELLFVVIRKLKSWTLKCFCRFFYLLQKIYFLKSPKVRHFPSYEKRLKTVDITNILFI